MARTTKPDIAIEEAPIAIVENHQSPTKEEPETMPEKTTEKPAEATAPTAAHYDQTYTDILAQTGRKACSDCGYEPRYNSTGNRICPAGKDDCATIKS